MVFPHHWPPHVIFISLFKSSFSSLQMDLCETYCIWQNQLGKDFPSTLEDRMEVKKYASAFHSAFNPVIKELVEGDEHIMRACFLLAIPPPPPSTSLRHVEIPMDLTAMSLPEWIDKIRDLATGMVVLPPTFLVSRGVVQSSVFPKHENV